MCFLVKIEMNQDRPAAATWLRISKNIRLPLARAYKQSGENERPKLEMTEFRSPSRRWSATAKPSTLNVRSIPHSLSIQSPSRDTLARALVAPHRSSPR